MVLLRKTIDLIQIHDKIFVPYISEEEIDQMVDRIAGEINADYHGKHPLFIGIMNGSFMFASDIMKRVSLTCELSFVKFASYSGTTSTGDISQLVGLQQSVEGRHVVILEDIVDTGQTLEKVIHMLEEQGAASIRIASLLFKPTVFNKNYTVDYVGKAIPNKFVVGYGLDYDQHGRNLSGIYQIEEKNSMLNIVLFGPPGVGKGTQAERLVKKYELFHLSTGDVFRYNIKNETELGTLAKSYMDKGQLVPDEVTISMLESEVEKHPEAKGFIFDGFPRTIPQAEALQKFLENRGTAVKLMVALDAPEDELVKRLLKRAEESGRSDDADESIIRNRIEVYNSQTAVVADYYNQLNKHVKIDGVGKVDEITERIFTAIDNHK